MPSLAQEFSKTFTDSPKKRFGCPTCGQGLLVPDQSTFVRIEPTFSKKEHGHEAWDIDWIRLRFMYRSVCNNDDCAEIAFVSGKGSVEREPGPFGEIDYYEYFEIETFFPAPDLIPIPEKAPYDVEKRLKKCFALYWVDTSAAANALRASLEALMDAMNVPISKENEKGKVVPMYLHQRIEHWSETHKDYGELCLALKEVGNLGSHGETVEKTHFFDALKIYSHVLQQLFENNDAKMKELAEKIRKEIKQKKRRG
ncbi:DUF4145 domain-containing protein [Ruegeria atlantica]|uniref:DUF4145 domain-containing protein n=1 Tax=Ruegeria atlantica TaxID=81569 RepID=A0AA90YXZ3_9RHOB|nr:DUF4145 domain-containing protein [Ruegeria atlantica]NOE17104.1 DUF4145 domain-containing protein [Ruegeria atlantica]